MMYKQEHDVEGDRRSTSIFENSLQKLRVKKRQYNFNYWKRYGAERFLKFLLTEIAKCIFKFCF